MERAMMIDEIEANFESDWILVGEPETDEHLEVLSGKVLHHSSERDEVYLRAVALRPERFAMLYTGKMPEDRAVVSSTRPFNSATEQMPQ